MKIVLVTEFYYPHIGGVTEHVHHLARYLVRRGNEVVIVTSHVAGGRRHHDSERVDGIEVIRIGTGVPVPANGSTSRITIGLDLAAAMRAALRGADLVHVHSPLFPVLPYLALREARCRGLPTVGTLHTHFARSRLFDLFGRLVRRYAGAVDHFIGVSESAVRSVAPYVRAPVTIIPNGVDVAAWSSGRERPELAGWRNIVFMGRFDARNDVAVLLRAFGRVASTAQDTRLILVGDGPGRGRYLAQLPAMLRDRVLWAGAQTDLATRASYLASSELMVFTARIASHPAAAIEGLAAGRPIVAYDIEGVRGLITHGREGRLVPPGDEERLAAAILALLEDEPGRRAMGHSARARAECFDWPRIGARIEEVYDSVRRAGQPHSFSESVR